MFLIASDTQTFRQLYFLSPCGREAGAMMGSSGHRPSMERGVVLNIRGDSRV